MHHWIIIDLSMMIPSAENTPVQMDEVRPYTVLQEFEEDLSDSDYSRIQEDQTNETNETPGQ